MAKKNNFVKQRGVYMFEGYWRVTFENGVVLNANGEKPFQVLILQKKFKKLFFRS